ncbi:metallophosphoesterase [Actinomycetes bacterium KLBMP 9797]
MPAFVLFALGILVLIHLYLWKRLVRDTTRRGPWRLAGSIGAAFLAVLLVATMVGTRLGFWLLAWPGYLWLAVMFYLLVALVLLELPMLAAKLWLRRRRSTAATPALVHAAAAPASATKPANAAKPASAAKPADAAAEPPIGAAKPADAAAEPPIGATEPADAPAAPIGAAEPVDAAATDVAPPSQETAVPDHSRRLLLARGAAIFAGLTAAGVSGYGIRSALGPPQLDRVRIPLAKLPGTMDGTRIALVSDIHLGPLRGRSHTERIVRMINEMDADVVAVVGDLVDGSVEELGAAAAPLRDLRSRHGNFFVTGNHEYFSGHEEWIEEVTRLGLRPLRNERLSIEGLDLAGVNDIAGESYDDGPDFDRALAGRDAGRPVVLLAHQPVQAHEAARHGVDLQLSGHTHGGQMVPFNLLVALEQPVISGLGNVDGTPVYVTNGAGFWGPPVRIGAPPQVTLVELTRP